MKKIKVFLGCYINFPNAQNLNCRALAHYLDKTKFEIGAMKLYSGTLPKADFEDNIKLFKVPYPYRLTKYFAYFHGICWADIVYLPKGEIPKFTIFVKKLLKKKGFVTIEGIYDDIALKSAIDFYGSLTCMLDYYSSFEKTFSITTYLKRYNYSKIKLISNNKILYLGSDVDAFLNQAKQISELKNIIIIGNDLVRKGVHDFLKIASLFKNQTFHIVGSGNGKIDIRKEIKIQKFENVIYHDSLNHHDLKSLLKKMDLHLFPSRSEGFPKVTLETAAAGVPSLVYDDYGADEWITHGKNGYVVHTLEEMIETIRRLEKNPEELDRVSKNAVEMARRFDWKVVVKDWEEVIERLYNEK